MRTFFLAVAAALLSATAAFSAPATIVSEGSAFQFGAEQLIVRSPSIGKEFLVEVMTPHSPRLHGGQRFPAVYALDGGYGIAGMAGRLLGGTAGMANAYIVSVGHQPSDYGRRMHDLLWRPTSFMGSEVGGGRRALLFRRLDVRLTIRGSNVTLDMPGAMHEGARIN